MIKLKSLILENKDFPMKVYHGGKLNKDKPVIFVTRYKDVAEDYARVNNGHVHEFILTLNNPANNDIIEKLAIHYGIFGSVDDYDTWPRESPTYEYLSPEMVGYDNVIRMVKGLEKLGYDGAWIDGDASPKTTRLEYDSLIVFHKSQLKQI